MKAEEYGEREKPGKGTVELFLFVLICVHLRLSVAICRDTSFLSTGDHEM
jgi:hypothetical protein